jgi:glycerol transport system ATP-binding protein
MARIELSNLAHAYGPRPRGEQDYALRRMDHVWEDGGAYALLGPSGCGKTTLLNIISGLLRPSEGRVLFDGEDVTDLEPQARNIAQVFQFPVIYDTMTVEQNLAFPLRNRGVPEPQVKARVGEVAEMLELTADLRRRAQNLGADAKQKISLGRGLVRSDVAAILFDEPLTVIDPQIKFQLRRKLRQIHEELKITLVYVTHDQNEALTFADRVAVMFEGSVVQLGTPQQLFEAPEHTFVGYFIGSPGMNFLSCQLADGFAVVEGNRIPLAEPVARRAAGTNLPLELGIRPEFVRLTGKAGSDVLPVTIESIEDLGNFRVVDARLGGQTLAIKVPEFGELPDGDAFIELPPAWVKLYAGGKLVAGEAH